jgi:heptosyltransferase-3
MQKGSVCLSGTINEMLASYDKIRTVLIVMMDRHLGNLVVALSSIVALQKYFRGNNVYFAVDGAYREAVESIDGFDRIFSFPRREIYGSNVLRRTVLYLKFINEIRSMSPDAVIDLQGGSASSAVSFFSGAAHRLSNSSAKRSYVYNTTIDLPVGKHKVHSYMEIAIALGANIDDPYYRLHSSERRRISLASALRKHGIRSEKPIISIHAGAGNIHKQWTTEGFAGVADWLSAQGFQVIFIGADRDLDKIDATMSLIRHKAYNLGGSLSIGELMALFEMSSLFLGNDSGPMHLAAAMGTPIVALFGPVDERRWRPLSPNSAVLRGQEPCDDCRIKRKDCNGFPCITTLEPDKVKQAISELLAAEQS